MVSRRSDSINFGQLENDVHSAVEADQRYWTENDAKFRAIDQKVATYEEFRDIVRASHLKPLEKGDRLDNIKFTQPWNQIARSSTAESQTSSSQTQLQKEVKKPCNGHEFGRDWMRHCKTSSDKYIFLLWLGGATLTKIFKAEISLGLLGDILAALSEEYCSQHCSVVVDILTALTTANRFSLSVDFLSSREKDLCQKLFEKISADLQQRGTDKKCVPSGADEPAASSNCDEISVEASVDQKCDPSGADEPAASGNCNQSCDINTEKVEKTPSEISDHQEEANTSLSLESLNILLRKYGLGES